MREIKFRAFLISEEKMVDVFNLVKMPDEDFNRVFTSNGAIEGRNWQTDNQCHLMQYTGLKDKNGAGKEIYESDKFKSGIVVWELDGWFVRFDDYSVRLIEYISNDPKIEVIGNIHDEPNSNAK